ncbi:hypothetical protein EVAR_20783_1 [Eumeta japonica]|uniref:Uncharacterized protein n=1 Tax=Eumeta variegata TaxID=151549 RepID=A0A4C1UDN7_EUMVA|nr:hypothetical protein EVAR_20783_1 [Eumeta japonica]
MRLPRAHSSSITYFSSIDILSIVHQEAECLLDVIDFAVLFDVIIYSRYVARGREIHIAAGALSPKFSSIAQQIGSRSADAKEIIRVDTPPG